MKLLEFKLSEEPGTKTLGTGKLLFDGCLEIPFRLFDGQFGPWLKVGMSFKNKEDKWINTIWQLKNDEMNKMTERVVAEYTATVQKEGGRLDDLHSKIVDENVRAAASVTPEVQNFTSKDIPF